MTLTDGTTSVTVQYADERQRGGLDKDTKISAGGLLRSQTSGERFKLDVKIRATPEQYRSLLDLLNNGSLRYYYTPEETYSLYSGVTLPIEVEVSNLKREWDNRKYYYLAFTVEGTEYL